jgi:hypothetical protein
MDIGTLKYKRQSFTQLLYAIKNLKNLLTILLLILLISCDNDKVAHKVKDKSINELQTKEIKDSIKQNLTDSVKLEARKALVKDSLEKDSIKRNVFIKDSLAQVEFKKMQLLASKSLDSIYPIWKDKKLDSLKIYENNLAKNNSDWRNRRNIRYLKSTISLVDWLISFDEEKFKENFNSSNDTIKEIKKLIEGLINTPGDKWKEMGLIHPLFGYSIYVTPGAHINCHRLHGKFDGKIGVPFEEVIDYFKILFKHVDHPKFESILIKGKWIKGTGVNDMVWGGGGCLHIDLNGYVGYRVFDYLEQHHAFNFTDSLFDRGLIDINRNDWDKKRMREKWKIIINNLSKTNSKNLALFIIGVDLGKINFKLLNKTSNLLFIEGETISFKNNFGPTFKRINGKLYFHALDEIDDNSEDPCSRTLEFYDENSDCYLFK